MGNFERIFKISEMLIAFSKKTFVLGNEQIVECALSAVNFLLGDKHEKWVVIGFLRSRSCATPADLLATSMAG